jgi:linoleoyl-CoA desaturase
MRKARFTNEGSTLFYKILSTRVNEYFLTRKISKHANRWMITKIFICITLYLFSYMIIILDFLPAQYLIIFILLFGFSCALVGFNIAHDASHGALFSSRRLNVLFSYSFEMIGISSYAWHVKHNVVHHNNPNLQNGDFDLEGGPVLRFSPADKRSPIHRIQHIYAPVAYMLLSLAMHFTLSILLAIILIPAHVFELTEYPVRNAEGMIAGNWALYQMRTTMDYSRKSRLCNFLFGGLNINVVHHLYPRICHVHLMAISDIVKATAEEFNIIYHNASIWDAMRSHFAEMRNLGKKQNLESI